MKAIRWGLVREQILVQLKVRTLNFFTLAVYIIQPAVFTAVGMLLSRAAGNSTPDLVYSVIGGGIMGMWSGLVFTSTYDITGDRRNGMLELIVGSPTSLAKVEALRTFTNVLSGLFSIAVAVTAAMLLFGYSLKGANLWGAAISFVLLLFAMWCIGVFLANFLAWSRLSGTFVDFLEMPIAFLCGFMYPIRVLPGWVQVIAGALPIRWALEAMNESLLGTRDLRFLGIHWLVTIGLSLVFMLITRRLQVLVHNSIRVTGELTSI
jgi:ABC-2 type transport system permease protein